MRRTSVALIPLVVSAILAGCAGDQETTAPRTLVPRASSSSSLSLTCDGNTISAISQDAKKYFANNDPVFALITAMKSDLKTSVATATPKGFEILARTAEVRRKKLQTGTNVQGGTFVLDVITCMSVGAVPETFLPASALGSGVFEVRTGGSSEGPAVAYTALTAKSTTVPSPEWGAERKYTSDNSAVWPYVVGSNRASNSYLVYGYPLGTDGVVASGFELGTLPIGNGSGNPSVDISSNPLGVGICTASAVTDVTTGKKTANLLNHNGEVLNLQKLSFCNQTFTVGASGSWLRSLPGRLLALVKPTTLFAQDEERGFVGGLPSGWSPNTVQSFINTDITVAFTRQPVDAKLKINLDTIVVQVATDAAMPPVNVRLTIANNSGQPAFLTDADSNDPSAAVLYVDRPIDLGSCTKTPVGTVEVPVTHTACQVTFRIGFTKAGGYTLNAAGYIGGGAVSTAPVISNLFNVKNQ